MLDAKPIGNLLSSPVNVLFLTRLKRLNKLMSIVHMLLRSGPINLMVTHVRIGDLTDLLMN